ncbi:MAG: hypothetical protein ABR524_12080, partial [Thermoanaerobaculia bacterium]
MRVHPIGDTIGNGVPPLRRLAELARHPASEFRSDSKPTLNQKGLYFFDRQPKDSAFYYRAALTGEPVLRIARNGAFEQGAAPRIASSASGCT